MYVRYSATETSSTAGGFGNKTVTRDAAAAAAASRAAFDRRKNDFLAVSRLQCDTKTSITHERLLTTGLLLCSLSVKS